MSMARRGWLPARCESFIREYASAHAGTSSAALDEALAELVTWNRRIHERECVNLNPATNVMNPRAEALLSSGLGSRPSLGYPGDKYEMGLEAIERVEILAAQLACRVFDAEYAEIRMASGSMANLYAFMATCKPGDRIIVPPASIGGHVTHHEAGAAGLFGLEIHAAPVDATGYTIDADELSEQARRLSPALITVGGSLNLFPHPVAQIRAIADEVGAKVLFDAAHLSGLIAGRAWQQPLAEGAHLMTMSTYKSLGGPPSGLLLTDDSHLAERVDAIAFPGLTANFDASKSASLTLALLDWVEYGERYARAMQQTALALAQALLEEDIAVFAAERGCTTSHQFALPAAPYGGGQAAAKRLREANLLTCGIGLPLAPVAGDLNGLRIGTPEIVRRGMTREHMPELAALLARALREPPGDVAGDVSAFRARFDRLHFVRA
jgi:glycine hydroxymethyltransferase